MNDGGGERPVNAFDSAIDVRGQKLAGLQRMLDSEQCSPEIQKVMELTCTYTDDLQSENFLRRLGNSLPEEITPESTADFTALVLTLEAVNGGVFTGADDYNVKFDGGRLILPTETIHDRNNSIVCLIAMGMEEIRPSEEATTFESRYGGRTGSVIRLQDGRILMLDEAEFHQDRKLKIVEPGEVQKILIDSSQYLNQKMDDLREQVNGISNFVSQLS